MTLSRTDASHQLDGAGLRAKRALGQNFVVDANTVRRIARLAGVEQHPRVLEIGAGLGSLTMALAEIAGHVTAVEVDDALLPLLNENVGSLPNVNVVHADAMQIRWPELLGENTDWVLVANLPYNVATPLIADVLDFVPQVQRMLVMVQKEVADRLCAGPGSRTYGIPSVKIQWFGKAEAAGNIGKNVFWPAPNVDSGLVRVNVSHPYGHNEVLRREVFQVIDAAFAHRRKTLRAGLANFLGSPAVSEQALTTAGIDPRARAETLELEAFVRLTEAISELRLSGR